MSRIGARRRAGVSLNSSKGMFLNAVSERRRYHRNLVVLLSNA